ncbi:hypothetical protein HanIR_Chr13g0633071 [Helianthus annuus]|nr:hypothetical protein HanIR_Chr13g0633071 [Helianthus annuus]
MVDLGEFPLQISSSSLGDRGFLIEGFKLGIYCARGSLAQTRLRQRMLDLPTFANNSHLSKKKSRLIEINRD